MNPFVQSQIHEANLKRISARSSSQDAKDLANAELDTNQWVNSMFEDLKKVFQRLGAVEKELEEAKAEIRRLQFFGDKA